MIKREGGIAVEIFSTLTSLWAAASLSAGSSPHVETLKPYPRPRKPHSALIPVYGRGLIVAMWAAPAPAHSSSPCEP